MLRIVGFVARSDETRKWYGRFIFNGAALRFAGVRIARIIDGMSPLVFVYTCAIASTSASDGSYWRSHRIIFLEMNFAVFGWASSMSMARSPSWIPAAPVLAGWAGNDVSRN